MWIRRLAVEHWRGLTYTLDHLAPGLNLIAGANEAGKSRLVQALRFALFESTKGRSEHKRSLASWGLAPEKPRVTIEFELAGGDWHLEKVFLGSGCNTRLRGNGQTFDGEAAETRLAELLDVTVGGSSELKPEDRGVWSLLWVDQGASREQPAHNESAHARILDQLSLEIGEVAAGTFGQQVLARAEANYGQLFSVANGRPLKALTDPEAQVAQIRERLAAALDRRAALAQTAQALAGARENEQHQATRLAAADARLVAIAARFETAQSLQHRLEIATGEVRIAEQQRDQALARQQGATGMEAELARLRAQIDAGTARRIEAQAVSDAVHLNVSAAGENIAALQARIAACDADMARLRARERRARQRADLDRLRTRLADAGAMDMRITELRTALAGLPSIAPDDAAALRRAEVACNTARARLDGASASLVLTARQPLAIDGEPLTAGSTRELLFHENRRIEVDGLLSITVNPGGGEIVRLREELHDAERQRATLLTHFGIADVEAGEQAAQRRSEIQRDLDRAAAELARAVPEGIDELKRQVFEFEAVLAALPAGPGSTPIDIPQSPAHTADEDFDPAQLETAEAESRTLNLALQETRALRDAEIEGMTMARETLAGIAQQLDADRATMRRLGEQRAELPGSDALARALADAERTWSERVAARDEARRQFDACGGSNLALDLEQARQAAQQLRDLHQRTVGECIELAAVLKAGSNQALHEEVLDLEAELAESESRLARVRREAAAAQRLYQVLTTEFQAARDRLTQPVIERIRPYLADLFPGSEVWLNEELGLKGLRSANVDEHFEELSGGAREQLSLLVRIGLAEVLGADESWPLVLDDVLVNTDASRIQRMQRALYRAGRQMQILLFTCHGALFDTLGPDAWIELPPPPR